MAGFSLAHFVAFYTKALDFFTVLCYTYTTILILLQDTWKGMHP